MNESPYKISGANRRLLKKELAELKSIENNFWYWEDIDRVYGGGLSDDECEEYLIKNRNRIEELEKLLEEPSDKEKRNIKLENIGIKCNT
jgi:hypothetical protein